MIYLNILLAVSAFFLTSLMIVSSVQERHLRATVISTIIFTLNSSFWWFLFKFSDSPIGKIVNISVFILIGIFSIITFFKNNPEKEQINENDIQQFDERDHMFARSNLKKAPELAKKYYSKYPEKLEIDKAIASKPGLLQKETKYFHPLYSKAADSVFSLVSKTHNLTVGTIEKDKTPLNKQELTKSLIDLAKYYGAVDIGITKLKKSHLYSFHGRHIENWGQPVDLNHEKAIVIIVKMDLDMINNAPGVSATLESSKQYLESAKIAYVIAEFIRSLGYDAKAHVDGKYDVLCAPLAEDAQLGSVGRMGIFMHKIYGPSVRISVITTDIDLELTKKENFSYMDEFCDICKKCADNCPTGSILKGKKTSSRGFFHWSINMEKCFSYWNTIGTDCAFCIKTCPFSKPNTLLHKMARWYISRNHLNRHIALLSDDLLYGRKIQMCSCNSKKIV